MSQNVPNNYIVPHKITYVNSYYLWVVGVGELLCMLFVFGKYYYRHNTTQLPAIVLGKAEIGPGNLAPATKWGIWIELQDPPFSLTLGY